jgi:hypothetical protein
MRIMNGGTLCWTFFLKIYGSGDLVEAFPEPLLTGHKGLANHSAKGKITQTKGTKATKYSARRSAFGLESAGRQNGFGVSMPFLW